MDERLIRSAACLDEGGAQLAAVCPRLAHALALCAPLPLRLRPGGFRALVEIIIGQQVSVASAAAITRRMEEAGLFTVAAVRAGGEDALRAAGLSRPKARYVAALAEAGVDYDALEEMPSDEVIATLMALLGIGRWSAEIYTKFCLARADVIAAGDLALQEGARMLYDLDSRPDEAALRLMAEAWAPWRSVAARLLWAYYAKMKSREGVT